MLTLDSLLGLSVPMEGVVCPEGTYWNGYECVPVTDTVTDTSSSQNICDDLTSLLDEIATIVGDFKRDRYTNNSIVNAINLAARDIADKAYYFRDVYETHFNLDGKIDLPDNFIRLYYIQYKDTYIKFITKGELLNKEIYSMEQDGSPYYAVVGVIPNKHIEFFPKPTEDMVQDIDETVTIHYAKYPSAISLDNCENIVSSPILDMRIRSAVIFKVVHELLASDRDANSQSLSARYETKYNRELIQIKREVQKQFAFNTNSSIVYKNQFRR